VSRILAIDPGTTQSGWIRFHDGLPAGGGVWSNGELLDLIAEDRAHDVLAIEMIAGQGMAVGMETFRTVWWIGRFAEAWYRATGVLPREVFRRDVKLHLCGNARAKDKNIRQALVDRYGGEGGKEAAFGRKASPGPLYGVTSHAMQALAVAVTAQAQIEAA